MDLKRGMIAKLLSVTGMGRALATLPRRGVLVFNYHRIGDDAASQPYDRALWSASVDGFDAQVGHLARGFDVISPRDLDYALGDRKGRYALITFDDGYLDNYALAYPILRRHQVPAAFFIATGFIDKPSLPWWDEICWLLRTSPHAKIPLSPWISQPLHLKPDCNSAIALMLARYKSLPSSDAEAMLHALRAAAGVRHPDNVDGHWMNWDMIREMARGGMTIGGHTVNHPVLSRMPKEQQYREISGCAARLKAEVGCDMEYFAYPVGNRTSFNEDTRACLEAMNVRHAFSYYGGYATQASPRYDIPRVAMESHIRQYEFEAMASLPQVCARPYN